MAMPPNIRINARVPFPSLVYGTGPIVIGKQNGIFTVNMSVAGFATVVPAPGELATDYIFGYNSVTGQFIKFSISSIGGAFSASPKPQRLVTASPIVVAAADQILNCNIAAPATSTLPTAASRAGLALTYADVGGQCGTNNITISPNGAETINGVNAAVIMNANHQVFTFVPANDGTTTGWMIE